MRHLLPVSGKDSLACGLVQTAREPDLPYEPFFTDTGCELPDTYRWLDSVEEKTGWTIKRIGASLVDIIKGYGGFLPSAKQRYCTRQSKILPMIQWIGDAEATIYYGLRADEPRAGFDPTGTPNIHPRYPLQEGPIGYDLRGVLTILEAKDLLPPAFEWTSLLELLERNYPAWDADLPVWLRRMLLAWRSRANCAQCFYQAQYEFAGLFEHEPETFGWVEDLERWADEQRANLSEPEQIEIAADLFGPAVTLLIERGEYTIRQGYQIARFRDPAVRDKVRMRRAKAVIKAAEQFRAGQRLGLDLDTSIAATSCGVLCGK